MIALTFALARAWVRIYTRGLSAALRDARRAEIACDLWEQRHEQACAGRRSLLTALEIFGRVIRGVPSDLAWRMASRTRGSAVRRVRLAGAVARRHGWMVLPGALELIYVTGAAKIGTPGFVGILEQLAMGAGAAGVLCGMVLLWRGTAPLAAAWIVCLGALGPTLLIARSAPLSLLWAALAMRSAVRRSDALRAQRSQVALP
jgi:hypothetical protein